MRSAAVAPRDPWAFALLAAAGSIGCGSSGDGLPTAPSRGLDAGASPVAAAEAGGPTEAGSGADAGWLADAGRARDAASPQAGAGLWVYSAGAFNWPRSNDYSYALTSVRYDDTTGAPLSGAKDIAIVSQPFGGWQPAAGVPLTPTNWDQDVTGMKSLTFALRPTGASQRWSLFFHKVGDVYVYDSSGKVESVDVNSGAYGPAHPAPNQWSVYKVPLAEVLTDWDSGGAPGAGPAVLLTHVYKFAIADTTGAAQTWYVDDVGFVP